jgi:predicted nucleic acid-binding protein
MRQVFADTSFYQALLNPRDQWHATALHVSKTFRGRVMTSEYVLCELGALMSCGDLRRLYVDLVHTLQAAPHVEVIAASHELFEAGLDVFSSRPDKEWSLTDCISFTLMRRHGITEAFASDRHFEQAGFRSLLKEA